MSKQCKKNETIAEREAKFGESMSCDHHNEMMSKNGLHIDYDEVDIAVKRFFERAVMISLQKALIHLVLVSQAVEP